MYFELITYGSLCICKHNDIIFADSQVAFQQADFAGWNIWASINNRPLLPFRYVIRYLLVSYNSSFFGCKIVCSSSLFSHFCTRHFSSDLSIFLFLGFYFIRLTLG